MLGVLPCFTAAFILLGECLGVAWVAACVRAASDHDILQVRHVSSIYPTAGDPGQAKAPGREMQRTSAVCCGPPCCPAHRCGGPFCAHFVRVPHAAYVMQHRILSLRPWAMGWGSWLGAAGGCRPATTLQVAVEQQLAVRQPLLHWMLMCLHSQFLIIVVSPCVRPTCASATQHAASYCSGPAQPTAAWRCPVQAVTHRCPDSCF